MTMREIKWREKSRSAKLASVLYPNQVSAATRKEMAELSALEFKKAPTPSPLLSDRTRGATSPLGGVATKPRR